MRREIFLSSTFNKLVIRILNIYQLRDIAKST